MINEILNKYKNCDLSNIDVLIDFLIDLENSGMEAVFINQKYFSEAKHIIHIGKSNSIPYCVYLSVLDMDREEAINLIKQEKELNNINYIYEV
ncbi:hypothetical protein [Brachyspira sp. SAP_772]|uniref:hypothetical protein n=1 Tax=Brachyspira sp. SAP_772 TaxID=2608385 RepID=UPI0012F47F07|nr:hypothetical protein [Brachyspira sp. SAP_772]